MKLQELYELWDRLNQVVDNPRLDVSVKLALGGEILLGLPPVMLCGAFSLSRVLIEEDMKGRLNELKERNVGTREEAETEARKTGNREKETAKPEHGSKRTRKESV